MTDYIELPGGRLKEKPKAHIRGGKRGFGNEDWPVNSAEFKEQKESVALKQELGQTGKEPEEQLPDLTVKGADPNKPGRTWSYPAEDIPQETVDAHRFTGGDLRADLEVRNQPDPRKYSQRNGPKHFK